jgi:hypothetical protein
MAGAKELIAQLASEDAAARERAAGELYAQGCALGETAVAPWRGDADFAALLAGPPTVGIAVLPESFARIRRALGSPRLADVPADQDAQEFEAHLGAARLDILTTRGAPGAIARFLEKSGEGVQQVEYPVADVDRATRLVVERFAAKPVYPAARPGSDGTRVNFFLVSLPEGKRVLIELVESPASP